MAEHTRNGAMSAKISSVTVEGFRGVAGSTTLDFSNKDGTPPSSCLILGENGAGKSTFVDAIEFCLSGRPSGFSDRTKTSQVNLSGSGDQTKVTVKLSDGTSFSRTLSESSPGGRLEMSPDAPHNLFSGSGFVLRREDIINFLRTPANRRHTVFAAFMKGSVVAANGTPSEHVERIEEASRARDAAAAARIKEAKKLASLLRISIGRIKKNFHTVPSFQGWLASLGYIRAQAEKKKGGLTHHEVQVFSQANEVRIAIEKFLRASEHLGSERRLASNAPLAQVLREVSENLADSFKRISPSADAVESVQLQQSSNSLAIELHVSLKNGKTTKAEHYFSEANLDLLALLLFLSLLKFAGQHGQAKFMALDDVMQSVDSPVRVKVAKYLLEEFGGWQFLVTFHDRLWKEQFSAIFSPSHSFVEREIKGWTLASGPHLVQLRRDASTDLRNSLSSSGTRPICGDAGYLLEVISDWLSKSMQTSVTRRYGDKYTLGDTWPGVSKSLKGTSAADLAKAVDGYMWLRNLHGAHYNEWAEELSIQDAHNFGAATLALWEAIWCQKCRETVSKSGNLFHCRCGQKDLTKV